MEGTSAKLPIDPRIYDVALGCVHCGLCLPVCPTYTQTWHEADSPRGRIQLLRALADGEIEASGSVRGHLNLCLDCRGCETACPSGVIYHELIEESRQHMDRTEKHSAADRLVRWVSLHIFTHPWRLKLAMLPGRILQKVGVYGVLRRMGVFEWLPASVGKMLKMLPREGGIWPGRVAEITRAGTSKIERRTLNIEKPLSPALSPTYGERERVIGFFEGCVGSVVFEKVNGEAVQLLAGGGAEVRTPRKQVCCGAIHHHNAEEEGARELARKNIEVFEASGAEWICTTVAGCGAMLKEYGFLLRDDAAYAKRAEAFSGRVRDISEVLMQLGLPEMKNKIERTVTYHDACHLAHGQKVVDAPRELLRKIPGLKLIPLPESDICCGAAGTYNLTQPGMAGDLAKRKLKNIAATGSKICVAGNVGCAMHLQAAADEMGMDVKVVHPVELVYEAVGKEDLTTETRRHGGIAYYITH